MNDLKKYSAFIREKTLLLLLLFIDVYDSSDAIKMSRIFLHAFPTFPGEKLRSESDISLVGRVKGEGKGNK